MTVKTTSLPVHFKNIEDGVELDKDFVPLYFDRWCRDHGIGYSVRIDNNHAQMLFDDSDGHTCFALRWRNAWDLE